MARNIQVPMSLEFRPRLERWRIAAATIMDWSDENPAKPTDHVCVRLTDDPSCQSVFNISDLDEVWNAVEAEEIANIEGVFGHCVLKVFVRSVNTERRQTPVDPWQLRQEFFRL